MSQPPAGGASAGAPASSTDFGATTVSGTPSSKRKDGKATHATGRAATVANNAAAAAAPPKTRPPLVTGSAAWAPPGTQTVPQPAPAPQPAAPHVPPHAPSPGPVGSAGAPAAAKTTARPPQARGPRRAQLQLRHINPVTVLKFSCVLAVALFFVWLIVVGVLYGVLDASGVVGKVNDTVTTINGSGSKRPITAGVVFGGAAIVGVINVVLFIALSTVGALVYNLCADLVGGIELTLSER